jgi:hypothetical protein
MSMRMSPLQVTTPPLKPSRLTWAKGHLLVTSLWLLPIIYSPSAYAGDGDFGALVLGIFFALIGAILAALGTLLKLPTRRRIKVILLLPMMVLGGAIGFGLTILALEILKTPEQHAEREKQNGLPKLLLLSCSRADGALTQYLQDMSVMMLGEGERITNALKCTETYPFKPSTFVILSHELYRVSRGAEGQYCSFLKELHEFHMTPHLQALHEAKLPIACATTDDIPWVIGLKAWDESKGEPPESESIWSWLMFLKSTGVDFQSEPADIPNLLSRVIGHGEPRLIRFALDAGSNPLGFSGKKWPSGEYPKATEIWQERHNLPSDNPHAYRPLNYTTPEQLADIAYIDSKMIEIKKSTPLNK